MEKLNWLAAGFGALFLSQPAAAQDWPVKPVRFICAFGVGGSSDQIARLMADQLSTALGQPFIVENRPGGTGVAGAAIAAKSAPDGYNYLVVFDNHATNPYLQKNLPYDTVKDFTPIMLFATSPYGLVVNSAAPYRTLGDLIAAAKLKPGELTLGSSGVGSRGHLAIASLEQKAGFKTTQVAYRGPAQIMTDLIGGQITMQMGTFFFVSPFVQGKRVRALAVSSAARMAQWPDVPTIAEQGFPGFEVHSWWGIVAPTGVPKPILQKIHAEMSRILGRRETRDRLEQLGMAIRASTPQEFARHIAAEMAQWGKVVRDNKIFATE
jgi:tripartite-type tricarboxylate transporter receptor subunit TctC